MKQVDRGYKQISEAAAIGAESIDSAHEELSLEVGIEEQGYLFTYRSDEGEENMDVYFDELPAAGQGA